MAWQDKIGYTMGVIRACIGRSGPDCAIAFSGGKDSIVVAHIAAQMGIRKAIVDRTFYFTKQHNDITRYAEELGLECVFPETITWKHLLANEEMYFPQRADKKYLSVSMRQWKSIPKGAKELGSKTLLYGRRLGENNASSDFMVGRNGYGIALPIRTWTTLEVWEYMRDNNLRIPWVYRTKFAEYLNNAPWITLIGSKQWCWQVVFDTEQAVVHEASERGLPSAKTFFELGPGHPERETNTFPQSWFSKASSVVSPYSIYGLDTAKDSDDGITVYRS